MNPGDVITLNIEKVAHGGFCVARHEGVVIFVRHALPNEKVEAQLISLAPGKKSWFAQTIKVINGSKFRRNSPCTFFKINGCGGCDWMHTTASYQRQLKLAILIEQLERLGNTPNAQDICRMNDLDPDEKNWRTKIRLAVNENGELGFRKFRSNEIQIIDKCLIADEKINQVLPTLTNLAPEIEIEIVKNDSQVLVLKEDENFKINRKVKDNFVEASGTGFWQIHPKAIDVLSDLIENEIKEMSINSFLDLYAGVGVFAGVILKTSPDSQGVVIESDKYAFESAKKNLQQFKKVKVIKQNVENWIDKNREKYDLVVLDPPRAGAGIKVMRSVCKKVNKKIIYIACDPASLARDTAVAKVNGWKLEKIEAFDFFPMTHHFESVAVFTRG